MIRVTIALPDDRSTEIMDDSLSVKEILNHKNANFSRATVILDGCTLTPEAMNKPLRELGVQGDCTIAVCVKLDNA